MPPASTTSLNSLIFKISKNMKTKDIRKDILSKDDAALGTFIKEQHEILRTNRFNKTKTAGVMRTARKNVARAHTLLTNRSK